MEQRRSTLGKLLHWFSGGKAEQRTDTKEQAQPQEVDNTLLRASSAPIPKTDNLLRASSAPGVPLSALRRSAEDTEEG